MTDLDLHGEHLAVLPQRLETVTLSGGDVTQVATINQTNSCNQFNHNQVSSQLNVAEVNQTATQSEVNQTTTQSCD
jgi:hypothetical protein